LGLGFGTKASVFSFPTGPYYLGLIKRRGRGRKIGKVRVEEEKRKKKQEPQYPGSILQVKGKNDVESE
jgi:hypothetical protein